MRSLSAPDTDAAPSGFPSTKPLPGFGFGSVGHISRLSRVLDNDVEYVDPLDMLAELHHDTKSFAGRLREAHNVCEEHRDIATASLIGVWVEETERRACFL